MIKKISTSELRIGMYVHDLECGWLQHPFAVSTFPVKDAQVIQKIASAGIRQLRIDTDKGRDVEDVAAPEPANDSPTAAKPARTSAADEGARAAVLFREATSVIKNMMEDARMGKQVDVQVLNPMAERMVQSSLRNPHALSGITRIKTKDEYTFMHCVSVAGLMTTFAIEMGLDEETVHEVAIGGMVHDIGKTLVPDEVLNKPGKLEGDEFVVMKRHVNHSGDLLKEHLGLSQAAIDVTMMHHERMDGSGYPLGLKGDEISLIGQMAAIVDVYDALTSVRVYKDAWEPSVTLKKLLEWSPHHFNRELVQRFIKCLGIYPLGSLVELESGRLGAVLEQGEDMLRPRLRIIYDAKRKCYTRVTEIDLAKEKQERIVGARSPKDFGIDMGAFL